MKIISWNVNGLRACMNKGFMDFFNDVSADIFCIQETKMQNEQMSFEFPGYNVLMNSAVKKGYSGTAVFIKENIDIKSVHYNMGIEKHDNEGRITCLELDNFYIVNVYTPNSQRGLTRLDYRMEWEDDFKAWLCKLNSNKPIILCGDLNVAHNEIDLKNPKTNRKNAGFTDEERNKMTLLLSAGFVDTFRYLYPDKQDAYTWWSYMSNARANNVGWRIDYFIVSSSLSEKIDDSLIYPDIMGSDHCPVGLTIK